MLRPFWKRNEEVSTVHNQPNPRTWTIGLAQWILIDGSYNGFEVSKDYQFALEFFFEDFEIVLDQPSSVPSANKLDKQPNAYSIVAPVVYKDDEIYMLDLGGITAYDECPPKDIEPPVEYAARAAKISNLKVGDIIRADLYLNIDHYLYFEFQCFRDGVPPIIYTWHIDSIEKMTAGLMQDPGSLDSNAYCVDPSTVQWHETVNTFWSPDSRNVQEYILHCTLQPVSPVGREHDIPLA